MMLRILPVIVCLFLLSACAETQLAAHVVKQLPSGTPSSGSSGTFKVGNPYKIAGKRYTPKETYSFSQTGIASWYGPNFHGKKTANGEIFDMNELTAAHKTLQMPSLVRVTNLENGRSLVVRVNDRGPFSRGRVIDLSKRSAELLGFKHKGTAKVKIQVLPDESRKVAAAAKQGFDTRGTEIAVNENRYMNTTAPSDVMTYKPAAEEPMASKTVQIAGQTQEVRMPVPTNHQPVSHIPVADAAPYQPPQYLSDNLAQNVSSPVSAPVPLAPNPTGGVYVQAGAFGQHSRALEVAQNLQSFGNAKVYPAQVKGQTFYRVRLGPLSDPHQADAFVSRLASAGYQGAVVTE